MRGTPAMPIQAETRGAVPENAASFAVDHVTSLLRVAPEPVLFGRVKLTMAPDPAVERPGTAQVTIDLNGRPIHVHAAGETMWEAIQHACAQLRVRLERAARNRPARRGSRPVPGPGPRRHRSPPTPPLAPSRQPPRDRDVIRHKSYTLARETPDEAAAEAETLGYGFHLFSEKFTGEDSVIYRSGPGYRLALAHPKLHLLGPMGPCISVSRARPPRLTVAQAATRLDATSQPFLFFADAGTGRGSLLYHRRDGHYGLVTPAG